MSQFTKSLIEAVISGDYTNFDNYIFLENKKKFPTLSRKLFNRLSKELEKKKKPIGLSEWIQWYFDSKQKMSNRSKVLKRFEECRKAYPDNNCMANYIFNHGWDLHPLHRRKPDSI